MNKIKLSTIKPNPYNPRKIAPKNLKKLMDSISEFSAMLYLRPIVVDENNIILGGNQRYLALKALKFKDIPGEWIKKAENLTEDEKKRFIIADNVAFGEWDFEKLELNFDKLDLEFYGFDLKNINPEIKKEEPKKEDSNKPKTSSFITCPHCGEQFEI